MSNGLKGTQFVVKSNSTGLSTRISFGEGCFQVGVDEPEGVL